VDGQPGLGRTRWRLRSAAALLLAVGLAHGSTLPAAAAEVAFTIRDKRITESSGLARDPGAGAYWTINDSGDQGVAYAIKPDGKVAGTLNYRAQPFDVEAVAVHENRLYVGDIGDNLGQRDFVRVYYFDNPAASGLTVPYRAWDFRYPDGPHDAETLLVNENGRLFIVTKQAGGGAVYTAPKEPSRQGVNDLKKVGNAPSLVTDGTFLPGGERIALLSYIAITVVDAKSYKRVARVSVPNQKQPESLTVSLDDEKMLLVGSEGARSKVYAVTAPGMQTPTPTPSAEPEPDPGDEPSEEPADISGLRSSGTILAVGIAAFVALVAGLVVAVARHDG
jgi:hypothetical protein